MNTAFNPLLVALNAVAAQFLAVNPGHTATMLATHGWNQPALTLADLAGYATRLASEIREHGVDAVSDSDQAALVDFANRLDLFRVNTMPNFWGGNGPFAISAYLETLDGIKQNIRHLIPRQVDLDSRAASAMRKRLAQMTALLDDVVVDRGKLQSQLNLISEAYEAAEALPESLRSLKQARDVVEKIGQEAGVEAGRISDFEAQAAKATAAVDVLNIQAQKLVAQCEEAYRVTTSKGLAGAFDQRASGLTRSMQLWVSALVVALIVAAVLGAQRVALLSDNLAAIDPRWGVIGLNFILSILSVGAPLWFAWVATKQVNQRFRLAEDYAYKASIAKAYEGYRREAAKLDPEFSSRLFANSLTRMEEAPLRLMETTSHGSPLHEMLSSESVRTAMSTIPEFKEKVLAVLEEAKAIVRRKAL